jgi:predicted RNA-binding protein (virulence factor B family)
MSIQIGKQNLLKVSHIARQGAYLDGGTAGEILLPGKWVPDGASSGSVLEVFVYRDSEDRLICTTQIPKAQVGECAFLQAVGFKAGVGTFLDWGLEKDLLLPLREQTHSIARDHFALVQVRLDERSERIVATMRLRHFLHTSTPRFYPGQCVPLLVAERTPLGYRCVVNHSHFGMLYASEVPKPLRIGDRLDGYVREVRPDGKIDLRLERSGYQRIGPLAEQILEALKTGRGTLDIHDKSDPDIIRKMFGCSKKAFKQALGALLKDGRISLLPAGIQLLSTGDSASATSPRARA